MLCTQRLRYFQVLANKAPLAEANNAVAKKIDAGLATQLNTFPGFNLGWRHIFKLRERGLYPLGIK